ncbi:penicillin-binding protein [Peribacillus acanthi]|uniref:penicillin-binding protein n=1 Tax=Peribacillus acanthi TaxID=2171554 RepID=UPI000D3E555E|nr:penicillin-binding protein [Peribacillus acanthi]
MYVKQRNMNTGAAILIVLFGLLFFLLSCRFVFIQATGEAGGEVLAAKAQAKYTKYRTIDASRGSILDSRGTVIAEDTPSYSLVAILDDSMTVDQDNPQHVVDKEETAEKLSKYIDLEKSKILDRLQKEDVFQVEFGAPGRDLSHKTKQEIEALKLPGITFRKDTKRFYPNGVFASHVVGYVEKKANTSKKGTETETVGMLGLEKTLQPLLKETDGKVKFESDRWGFLLPNKKEEKVVPPKNGNTVQLTLDKKIQTFLEDSLNQVYKEYQPKELIAIVANPKTGAIYAMAQRPTFHPTTREGLSQNWKNLAIEENFEPGSTMKVFTLAAAVEEDKFNPNGTFVTGSYKGVSSDHSGIPRGKTITFLEGLQRSSNVAFATIAMEHLGADKFREYLTKFGFEQPTGIDLPNEVGGKILYKWKSEKITTSFGQGTVITPIQQIQAFSAIANDGKMRKPYVIDKVIDPNGEIIKETKPEVVGQPISASTAEKVRNYLETVVSAEKGTGRKYSIEGYKVAGKTGTAQIIGDDGRYQEGKNNYLFSFIGMAPKEDPQLIMYVAALQPELGETKTGADVLSAIFNPVMKSSLQYLNIKPSDIKEVKAKGIEDFTSVSITRAQDQLQKDGYEVIILGNGNQVTNQSPKPGSILLEGEKIILLTNGDRKMPDLTGWSLRDVMKVAKIANLDLNTAGSGYVTKQNIKPGTKISNGMYCIIELKPPEEMVKKEEESKEKDEEEVHD